MSANKVLLNLLLLLVRSRGHEVFEAVPTELSSGSQRFLREPLDQASIL
jgi:hypothetical protein